jgi:putative phosphoesterase
MKVVVFSDVHGNRDLLERIISFNPDADYFLSLGDSELPLGYLQDLDIIAVKGNYPRDAGFGYDNDIVLNGKKILMTHGHKYGVHKSLKKLLKKGFKDEYDIILYGHTHVPRVDKADNLLLMNPGSVYKPRTTPIGSYLLLFIEKDGTMTYEYRESETNLLMEK